MYSNPATLFDAYFMTQTASQTPLRKTLVDQVLKDYNSLRQSNTRLGAADKQRLDLHIQFLQDTQTKVNAVIPVCTQMRPADNLTDRKIILNTINSVITSMVACGLCNSFLGWAHSIEDGDPNNYHKWSHEGFDNDNNTISDATSYASLVENNRNILKEICLDLATKLDANHLLDDTVIVCMQEHNKRGHESWNVPVITFGGAGGTFKTGQYIDYRDMGDTSRDDLVYSRFGFPTAQLLANILQSMGMPIAEYEALNRQPGPQFKSMSGLRRERLQQRDHERRAGTTRTTGRTRGRGMTCRAGCPRFTPEAGFSFRVEREVGWRDARSSSRQCFRSA